MTQDLSIIEEPINLRVWWFLVAGGFTLQIEESVSLFLWSVDWFKIAIDFLTRLAGGCIPCKGKTDHFPWSNPYSQGHHFVETWYCPCNLHSAQNNVSLWWKYQLYFYILFDLCWLRITWIPPPIKYIQSHWQDEIIMFIYYLSSLVFLSLPSSVTMAMIPGMFSSPRARSSS